MVPPGLAMVSISEAAWKANAEAKMPRFYWDLAKAKKSLEKGQTPWTPGMTAIFAMSVSLDMMQKEGLENIIVRHAKVAQKARDGVKALGLPLFADEKYASNTVTSVAAAGGLDTLKMLKIMREERQIVLGGGQLNLSGKIFRIGHLGWVTEANIDSVLAALKIVLPQV